GLLRVVLLAGPAGRDHLGPSAVRTGLLRLDLPHWCRAGSRGLAAQTVSPSPGTTHPRKADWSDRVSGGFSRAADLGWVKEGGVGRGLECALGGHADPALLRGARRRRRRSALAQAAPFQPGGHFSYGGVALGGDLAGAFRLHRAR